MGPGIFMVVSDIIFLSSFMLCVTQFDSTFKKYPLGRLLGVSGAVIGFAGLVLTMAFSKQANIHDLVVRFDDQGNAVEIFKDETKWCRPYRCVKLAEQHAEISAVVNPITENPKVRHMKYGITIEIKDAGLFVKAVNITRDSDCPEEGPLKCQLRDAVLYDLYEFNNANSKELAKFYNPYSKDQTKELEELLRSKLEPALSAKGIHFVKLVSWSVE